MKYLKRILVSIFAFMIVSCVSLYADIPAAEYGDIGFGGTTTAGYNVDDEGAFFCTGVVTSTGVQCNGNLAVTGTTSLTGDVAFTGAISASTITTTGYSTVGGSLTVTGASSFTGAISVSTITAKDAGGLYVRDDGGNESIFIKDGGYVSIGTTTNAGNRSLYVNGVVESNDIVLSSGIKIGIGNLISPGGWATNDSVVDLTGDGGGLRIGGNAGSWVTDLFYLNINSYSVGIGTVNSQGLFVVDDGTFTVLDTGYVGISTSTPTYPLDVNGQTMFRSTVYVEGAGVYNLGDASNYFNEVHAASYIIHSLENIDDADARLTILGLKRGNDGLLDKSSMGKAYLPSKKIKRTYKVKKGDRKKIIGKDKKGKDIVETIPVFEEKTITTNGKEGTNLTYLWSCMLVNQKNLLKEIDRLKLEVEYLSAEKAKNKLLN